MGGGIFVPAGEGLQVGVEAGRVAFADQLMPGPYAAEEHQKPHPYTMSERIGRLLLPTWIVKSVKPLVEMRNEVRKCQFEKARRNDQLFRGSWSAFARFLARDLLVATWDRTMLSFRSDWK